MRKIIFVLFIALFLMFGCQQGKEGEGKLTPFIGGTTGLIVTFTADAPPAEVYDGGDFPFDIEVKLQNDGERSIAKEDVTVQLRGLDPVEFGKTSADFTKSPNEELAAKQKDPEGNLIESNPVYVTFDNLNHRSLIAGNLEYPVIADVCYKYGTDAVSRLCIKSDTSQTGVCTVTEEKPVLNSGAPIQVTTLSESVAGTNKIAFIFKIEQKGNGNVYKPATKCNQEENRANDDKVLVTVTTELQNLQCTGLAEGTATSGYVTLRGGAATIRCTQPISAGTDFLKTVSVKIDYDYSDDISTKILLKHTE